VGETWFLVFIAVTKFSAGFKNSWKTTT